MVRAMYGVMFLGIFLGVTSFSGRVLAGEDRSDDRVYQYVVKSAEGEFDAISAALETTAETAGWQVLSQTDAGVPDGCSYRARVLVLYDAAYASALLEANRITGPFAAVDRINLFEDENGTHVSLVNPVCINRTVLMDDEAYRTLSENHLQKLRTMITGAVDGTVSERAYGQERKKGRIGKTMGVMAGGDFIDKKEIVVSPVDKYPRVIIMKLDKNTEYIGVAANFYHPDLGKWKYLNDKKSLKSKTVRIEIGANFLRSYLR